MKNKNNETKQILPGLEIIKTVLIGIIISVVILCFFRFSIVNGQSMEPSLYNNEKLLLSKTAYTFSNPKRGDIVVAKPANLNVDYIIKRVIGIPGDTIEIKDNVIYVNDTALEEEYIKENMLTADITKFTLASDEYFLCGDNRNNSLDSRSEILGPITEDEIFGKIIINFSRMKVY